MVDIYSRRKARGYASRFRVKKERALDCILDLNMVWNLKLTIGRIPIDILRILVDRYLSKGSHSLPNLMFFYTLCKGGGWGVDPCVKIYVVDF